jgi:hypothetical protein
MNVSKTSPGAIKRDSDDKSDSSPSPKSLRRNMKKYESMFDAQSYSEEVLGDLVARHNEITTAAGKSSEPPPYHMCTGALDVNDLVPRPPDGGYGWVIVACVFMCNFVFDGCSKGFGVIISSIQVCTHIRIVF